MDLKYKNVIEKILLMFTNENYKEGDKLPTETNLMELFQIGRNTVRKAIMEMELEGIVIRKQGSGTFYIQHKMEKQTIGGLIGLSNFSVLGYIYPQIIKGIEDALYEDGYSMILSSHNVDSLRNISSLKMMLDQNIKGLVLDLSRNVLEDSDQMVLNIVKSVNIPIVTTHWNGPVEDFSTVALDDEHGAYTATKYLISKGHVNIGIIYKQGVQAGYKRFDGYCRALKEAGLEVKDRLVQDFNYNEGLMEVEQSKICTDILLERNKDITAIFYFNDQMAIEGYKAINQKGLKIPEDISVVGFDNYQLSSSLNPPLTTVNHPKEDLGYWAAKILVKQIKDNNKSQPKSLLFEPQLIVRDSVKDILTV